MLLALVLQRKQESPSPRLWLVWKQTPATGFLLTKSELKKIILFINTPSAVRNISAGRAGPRSIPSPLRPGTQLRQHPRGCPHFSLPTRTLALSEPCLRKRRDAHSHDGACGAARIPGHQGHVLSSPCFTTSRCGCTLLGINLPLHPTGSLGGILMKLGQTCPPPSPAPTCLSSLLRGHAVASSASDHTATEMLLPTPVFLPGSSHSEANCSQ